MAGMSDNLKKQADAYVAAQSIASDLLNNTRITASAYAKEAVMLREAHKEKLARLAAEEAARLAAEAEAAAAAAAEGGEEAEEE